MLWFRKVSEPGQIEQEFSARTPNFVYHISKIAERRWSLRIHKLVVADDGVKTFILIDQFTTTHKSYAREYAEAYDRMHGDGDTEQARREDAWIERNMPVSAEILQSEVLQ